MIAMRFNSEETNNTLLNCGIDILWKGKDGWSALSAASDAVCSVLVIDAVDQRLRAGTDVMAGDDVVAMT